MFAEHQSDKVAPGERVVAVCFAQPPRSRRRQRASGAGESGSWPRDGSFALVLTDRRLLVFDSNPGIKDLEGQLAEYDLGRISGFSVRKRLAVDQLSVSFADGSGVELDVLKGQRPGTLVTGFEEVRPR